MMNQAHTEYINLRQEEVAKAQAIQQLEKSIAGRAAEMAAKYPVIRFQEGL